jgi:AcrR family transcriptional regulator
VSSLPLNPAATLPDRILDAVGRLSMELGAGNITLEQVAQAAGVSKGGLLYHFPTKEALLLAMGQRYVQTFEASWREARERLPDEPSADLKASVLGVLCRPSSDACQAAAILAAAAHDPALTGMFRACLAEHTNELASSPGSFERKAIISLAIDGLVLREALRISPFSPDQRDAVIHALLQLADESCNTTDRDPAKTDSTSKVSP